VGQAVRGVVLAVMLFHAVRGIDVLVRTVRHPPMPVVSPSVILSQPPS
jgi:hypothetical protein